MQCAELGWRQLGDDDAAKAQATRRRMLAAVARRGALVLGTHFANRPAGRIVAHGDAFRFVPSA